MAIKSSSLEDVPYLALERKHELGQFLTPAPIASFMASLFAIRSKEVHLLDAGAGKGALTSAFISAMCRRKQPPRRIAVTAYEVDAVIIPELGATMRSCLVRCEERRIDFQFEIRRGDFIEDAISLVRDDLFGKSIAPFNAAILNPPYRKINSTSSARKLLREAGIETSNLYTGFLALAVQMLSKNGEMVAICPRSFCNGPYFKPFRENFLDHMALQQIHLFESRSAAFERDDVLQENIIVHATKSQFKPKSVLISMTTGQESGNVTRRKCSYSQVVSPRDPERFIHLVVAETDEVVRQKMAHFGSTLREIGVEVSTGRVVEFRAKQFLLGEPQKNTVPLIYPSHFNGGCVHWPKLSGRKPNAIRDVEQTQGMLVQAGIYVLVKRFSSKEEKRRIVACIYDPSLIDAERVGFENHLNYFHAHGKGLSMKLAKGLSAFLNSSLIDIYFRQFNGHTQVNATDLRSLRYPTRAELETLGQKIGETFLKQAELDQIVEKELL